MFFLTRALEVNDMTLQDVSLVYVRTSDMAEALRSGKVDAVTVLSAEQHRARERRHRAHRSFPRAASRARSSMCSRSTKSLRDRPDDVAGVIRAFYRAVRYAQEHPEEAWRIMSERERVTPEEFRARCTPASRWCRSPISNASSATNRACLASSRASRSC